jgi:hypothetical protein
VFNDGGSFRSRLSLLFPTSSFLPFFSFDSYPAVMQDCDAVILCYDAVDRAQEQEVSLWFEWFVKNPGLDDRTLCLVLAHSAGEERPRGRVTPPRQLQSAAFAMTNFEEVTLIEKEFMMLCERAKRAKEKGKSGDDRK